MDAVFSSKIILSDEAHFHLDGFVDRQNCRFWGSKNPNVTVKKQMNPQRVTVWCRFWAGGISGLYFFDNEAGQAVTVTGARHRDMITQFFLPKLDDINVNNMWFPKDGATCHTHRETLQLLRETFPGFGDQNWPSRSCDLTPLNFFLWGCLKSQVYVNKSTTTRALEEIQRCINKIQPYLYRMVMENFDKRVCMCMQSRGSHLSYV